MTDVPSQGVAHPPFRARSSSFASWRCVLIKISRLVFSSHLTYVRELDGFLDAGCVLVELYLLAVALQV